MYAICRRNKAELDRCGDQFGINKRYTDYDELLKDPNVDAVHINSPDPRPRAADDRGAEGRQARRLHRADGRPPSRSASRSSSCSGQTGKVYMMMETVVYSREYLFAKDLYDRGVLGRIQFLRGSHQQDMDGWPDYWPGLPPMWYATHCVSPCLAILSDPGKGQIALAESVVCHGSGRIREELITQLQQPVRHRDGDVQDQGITTWSRR